MLMLILLILLKVEPYLTHPIQRTRLFGVSDGRAHGLAAHRTTQSPMPHQAFDRTACDLDAFALHLPPDLVCAVDLKIGLPDVFDRGYQSLIAFGALTAQGWNAYPRGMAPIARRGDLQDFADRLDPVQVPVLIDETHHFLIWRSSSA